MESRSEQRRAELVKHQGTELNPKLSETPRIFVAIVELGFKFRKARAFPKIEGKCTVNTLSFLTPSVLLDCCITVL